MDLNVFLYLALFLIILGLFLASLVRRKMDDKDEGSPQALPGLGSARPEQEEFGDSRE